MHDPVQVLHDTLWLWWRETDGLGPARIARRAGVSPRTVQLGLKRAREAEAERQHRIVDPPDQPARDPRLVPLFPVVPFTPGSACSHHGPILWGSVLCCMVCHRSGLDGMAPGLQRSPATDPRPDPKPGEKTPGKLTRKEKRARRR